MRTKNYLLGLPLVAVISVLAGALLSDFVLSLSPVVGFAVIFGAGVAVVAGVDISAYLRRRRRRPGGPNPDLLALSLGERKRRTRREPHERDLVEVDAELTQESWVQ